MTPDRPVRIAYLSYSSGLFDARSFRMAAWAASRGHQVTIYARWEPGLPVVEEHEGYRIVRAPWTPRSLLPGGWKAGRTAQGAAGRPTGTRGGAAPGGARSPKAPAPP